MNHERVDSEILAIKQRLYASDSTALADAERFAEQYPDQPRVWHMVAFARARSEDMAGAVAAITRMMALVPATPAIFFDRGRYALEAGNLALALADFSDGIVRSAESGDARYLGELYFHRAETNIALCRKAEARADLAHLPDDYRSWTTTLRTKAEMLAECDE